MAVEPEIAARLDDAVLIGGKERREIVITSYRCVASGAPTACRRDTRGA